MPAEVSAAMTGTTAARMPVQASLTSRQHAAMDENGRLSGAMVEGQRFLEYGVNVARAPRVGSACQRGFGMSRSSQYQAHVQDIVPNTGDTMVRAVVYLL